MPAYPAIENPVFTVGGVPFEFQFETYTEQTNKRAANTFIRARCYWEDKDQFLTDVQGFSLGFAGENFLYRILPLQDPINDNLWCTDCKLLEYPSASLATANQYGFGQNPAFFLGGGMFQADYAVYGLTFSRLPYFSVDNDTLFASTATYPNAPTETLRYCMTAFRPRAREFTVKSFGLCEQGVPTNVLPIPAFVMDQEMDLMVTILEFPAINYPFTAIKNTIGKTNNAAVDIPFSFVLPNIWTMRTFATDTLLFRGVATDITPYQGPDGRWYIDIPYFFTYRPVGWRKLPNPTGDGAPITVQYKDISPTKFLYDQVDYKALFKPEP